MARVARVGQVALVVVPLLVASCGSVSAGSPVSSSATTATLPIPTTVVAPTTTAGTTAPSTSETTVAPTTTEVLPTVTISQILGPGGKPYAAGENCPKADLGVSTMGSDGLTIICEQGSGEIHQWVAP